MAASSSARRRSTSACANAAGAARAVHDPYQLHQRAVRPGGLKRRSAAMRASSTPRSA
jgi:hypothetical protein